MKYTMTEKHDLASTRKGEELIAATLTAAKRAASRRQVFQGTTLVLEDEAGRLVAHKEPGRGWVDAA